MVAGCKILDSVAAQFVESNVRFMGFHVSLNFHLCADQHFSMDVSCCTMQRMLLGT